MTKKVTAGKTDCARAALTSKLSWGKSGRILRGYVKVWEIITDRCNLKKSISTKNTSKNRRKKHFRIQQSTRYFGWPPVKWRLYHLVIYWINDNQKGSLKTVDHQTLQFISLNKKIPGKLKCNSFNVYQMTSKRSVLHGTCVHIWSLANHDCCFTLSCSQPLHI